MKRKALGMALGAAVLFLAPWGAEALTKTGQADQRVVLSRSLAGGQTVQAELRLPVGWQVAKREDAIVTLVEAKTGRTVLLGFVESDSAFRAATQYGLAMTNFGCDVNVDVRKASRTGISLVETTSTCPSQTVVYAVFRSCPSGKPAVFSGYAIVQGTQTKPADMIRSIWSAKLR